ncbi:hypothetical protein [Citrobacter arsenatis]|uniref:hypothetical protein n=1 Tax=Citrobacter arsenatis TaxID=2546350 RepID=UPI00300DF0B3
MHIKQTTMALCIISMTTFCLQKGFAAGTSLITDNGKTATLTLPLKATISADSILRDSISVMPLSSLYEIVKWDGVNNRFKTHEFLVRVNKDSAVPILFEVINDQYTCSYNNPDRMNSLPADIAVVNSDYKYSVSWSGKNIDMGSGRTATVDDSNAWLPAISGTSKFIDLTLNITFPEMSSYIRLMTQGGICRGSVTMLLSNKL